jgi:hypothetical protein
MIITQKDTILLGEKRNKNKEKKQGHMSSSIKSLEVFVSL